MCLVIISCYSAQEYSALQAFRAAAPNLASASPAASTAAAAAASASAAAAAAAAAALPLDISIETVVGLLTTCLGLVLGASTLRPIQWREWAGLVEREGEDGFRDADGEVEKDYIGNPFRALETRPGFVDIRKQRREFIELVKSGSLKQKRLPLEGRGS